jgi:hypothetical protein
MLRVKLNRNTIQGFKESGLVYVPDFIIYEMDEHEYHTFWQDLKDHPREQLYTDGIQIHKVSWLQSVFQSFKGWLGFENHCQTNKVEMTLAKIAYVGYLKGFQPPKMDDYPHRLVSTQFKTLLNQKRTDHTTATIQRLMTSYYITHSAEFPVTPYSITYTYPFGSVLTTKQLYSLVPALDPQDKKIIAQTISGMSYSHHVPKMDDCFHPSFFTNAYAQYLVSQRKYLDALKWDSTISMTHKEIYIDFYLHQPQPTRETLEKAVMLIAQLYLSPKNEDQKKVIDYLTCYFREEDQLSYLKQHPELAKKLAQHYLQEAKNERSQYSLIKLLTGDKFLPLLAHAVQLDPAILDHDNSMHDVVIREEWTIYLLKKAIETQRFSEAKALFEQHRQLKFEKNHLSILRTHYLLDIETKKQLIQKLLEQSYFEEAEATALNLSVLAKNIPLANAQDATVIDCTIEYASTLLAIDKMKNPESENADLKQLNKAQELLNTCSNTLNKCYFKNPSSRLNHLIDEVLVRKIECLIEKIKGPSGFADSWNDRSEFANAHKEQIDELVKHIDLYLDKNKEQKNPLVRSTLAKMHYIKADVLDFFLDNKNGALEHFLKASKIKENNPYYKLRYLELLGDEKRHEIRESISQIRINNETDYNGWMKERWDAGEKCLSPGFEIHGVELERTGFFARLFH